MRIRSLLLGSLALSGLVATGAASIGIMNCAIPFDGDGSGGGLDDQRDDFGGSGGSIHDSPVDNIGGLQASTSGDDGDKTSMISDGGQSELGLDPGGSGAMTSKTLDPDTAGHDVS